AKERPFAERKATKRNLSNNGRSAIEGGRRDADVQAEVREAVAFHEGAAHITGRSGPIVIFHTNGQVILLIEVNHASVKGKLPAAVVRMEGLDADAALSVIVIFGRAHQRFVDEPLLFPALGEPVDHM